MINKDIELDISGLGIILYSESNVKQIKEGEDYFLSSYSMPQQVAEHVMEGRIVGFCTGSSGVYILRIREGYPDNEILMSSEFKLRLGIEVIDNGILFRDLYDLMEWDHRCPTDQYMELENGYYQITLFGELPESGIIGDNQVINVYLNKLQDMPELKYNGVPIYCD